MKVYKEDFAIKSADIFQESPYPFFRSKDPNLHYDCDKLNVPQNERETFGYGAGWRVLPYRMQNSYNTANKIKTYNSVVLENNILKVRILPDFGGMVYSIYHKKLEKELIYSNSVIQPRNLALCDAWLSGGIEFNTAQLGHHYLTCRPIHTALVKDGNEEFVRMFAWERVKEFPYQIDLHLPDNSEFLFLHVKLINPHNKTMPMYWWTNIGMEEYEGGRVIAPCDTMYQTVGNELEFVHCPINNNIDKSYVTNCKSAYDLFFHIEPERRKWEVLVDKEGNGLLHVATDLLKSTKVFAWGTNPGSRHWSEYLSEDGAKPFQEIQFGLAPTQMHSEKMPPNTTWEWTEAISAFSGDKNILHGDWKKAYEYGTEYVDKILPKDELDKINEKYTLSSKIKCHSVLHIGLGWGQLENILCEKLNKKSPIPNSMAFSCEDLNEDQKPWIELLNNDIFPEIDITDDPGQFMLGKDWEKLLKESIESGKSNHWFVWLNLGIMARERLDFETFEKCIRKSLQLKPSSYGYFALSYVYDNDEDKKFECYLKAYECVKHLINNENNLVVPIVGFILSYYIDKKEFQKAKKFHDSLSNIIKENERVRLKYGYIAFELGNMEEVEKVLNSHFDNIAEGEISVTGLWYKYYAKKVANRENKEYTEELLNEIKNSIDPPHDVDFRMFIGDGVYVPPTER